MQPGRGFESELTADDRDEHIEAAEFLCTALDEAVDVLRGSHVARKAHGHGARGGHLRRLLLRAFPIGIGHGHGAAGLRKAACDGPPDSAAAPSDHERVAFGQHLRGDVHWQRDAIRRPEPSRHPAGGSSVTRTAARLSNDSMIHSTMRNVRVDRDAPTQLHEQVAAEIRRAIAEGEAKPGERLPPAKDLAAVLGVNTNTVLRALRELRDEGLLEFRRGRGITVSGTPQRGAVVAQAKELVSFARQQGYRLDELVKIIENVG